MMRLFLLMSMLAFVGCSGHRPAVERTYESDDLDGDETYGTSVSFAADDAQARLRDASALVRSQDFSGAVAVYRELYQDASLSPDDRATALLRWAEVESNPLNPERNVSAAEARLKLLVETFPDAKCRYEAEDAMDRLMALPPPPEQ